MDYQGQKLAELLMVRILVAFAAISFVAGYALGRFDITCWMNAAALGVTSLLVVPDWPLFNQQKLQWLPLLQPEGAAASKRK
jgi:signal peptidase complex subunit 1